MTNWTLLSNHGHVLVCLVRNSDARLRDVAADVGITERAVQKIVRDLQAGGMVSIIKNGRRNSYRIHKKQSLRHELEEHCTLRDFITLVRKPIEKKRQVKPKVSKPMAMGIGRIYHEKEVVDLRSQRLHGSLDYSICERERDASHTGRAQR